MITPWVIGFFTYVAAGYGVALFGKRWTGMPYDAAAIVIGLWPIFAVGYMGMFLMAFGNWSFERLETGTNRKTLLQEFRDF